MGEPTPETWASLRFISDIESNKIIYDHFLCGLVGFIKKRERDFLHNGSQKTFDRDEIVRTINGSVDDCKNNRPIRTAAYAEYCDI